MCKYKNVINIKFGYEFKNKRISNCYKLFKLRKYSWLEHYFYWIGKYYHRNKKANFRTWYLWTNIKFKTIKSTVVSEIRNQYTNQIKEVYPNNKTAKLDNKVHNHPSSFSILPMSSSYVKCSHIGHIWKSRRACQRFECVDFNNMFSHFVPCLLLKIT